MSERIHLTCHRDECVTRSVELNHLKEEIDDLWDRLTEITSLVEARTSELLRATELVKMRTVQNHTLQSQLDSTSSALMEAERLLTQVQAASATERSKFQQEKQHQMGQLEDLYVTNEQLLSRLNRAEIVPDTCGLEEKVGLSSDTDLPEGEDMVGRSESSTPHLSLEQELRRCNAVINDDLSCSEDRGSYIEEGDLGYKQDETSRSKCKQWSPVEDNSQSSGQTSKKLLLEGDGGGCWDFGCAARPAVRGMSNLALSAEPVTQLQADVRNAAAKSRCGATYCKVQRSGKAHHVHRSHKRGLRGVTKAAVYCSRPELRRNKRQAFNQHVEAYEERELEVPATSALVCLSTLYSCAVQRQRVDVIATIDARSRRKYASHRIDFSLIEESLFDWPAVRVVIYRHAEKALPTFLPGQKVLLKRFAACLDGQMIPYLQSCVDSEWHVGS